jgi:hypothetical protein
MSRRRIPLVLLLAVAVLAPSAQAAESTSGWGVLAALGPTHLPPKQSEVQRVTVEGEAGTFTLTQKSGEGTATPVKEGGFILKLVGGSAEAEVFTGAYEVGERVSGPFLPEGTTVIACSSDCKTAGTKLTLSNPALGTGNHNNPTTIFTKQLTGASAASGTFHVGDVLSGEGLAPETVITGIEEEGVDSGIFKLTTTKATTSEYTTGPVALTISETSDPVPFDATAGDLQEKLDELPAFLPGSFQVGGGPGGDAAHPYYVHFGGPEFADKDVAQLSAAGQGLGTHGFVHVFTTVPGGPGQGTLIVVATNRAVERTGVEETVVEVGPFPRGVVATGSPSEGSWNCGTGIGGETVSCRATAGVPALSHAETIKIPVQSVTGAPVESSVPIRVSGGDRGQASYQAPIVVSEQPAKAGVAAFAFGTYEADGTPSTQAGGHPYSLLTEFFVNTVRVASGEVNPAGDARNVVVDLPPGLLGDPLIVGRCPQSALTLEVSFQPSECIKKSSAVGLFFPSTHFTGAGAGTASPIVSNIPAAGTAAQFSTKFISPIVGLFGSVRSEGDFGLRVSSPDSATQFDPLFNALTVFNGFPEGAGGKAFFSNPSDCAEQARETPQVRFEIESWWQPAERASALSAPLAAVTGCDKLAFRAYDPKTKSGQVQFGFRPTSYMGSSPVGADAHLHMDQSGLTDPDKLATPPLKRSVVKLPPGLTVNPSQANGLQACSEAQVGYVGGGALPNPTRFNNNPVTCPDGSKLGTAEATTPLLEEPLKGTIYLANQEENPFHTLIGLYLVFESPRFGVTLKLPGRIDPDPNTGQLTATFDFVPQQPVEDLTLHFRGGGPRSELATPEVCGTYTTEGSWEPWSAPESGPPAITKDSFEVQEGCMESAAERFFEPSFEAGTTGTQAGSYTPLVIKISRKDGEQELKSLDFTLPKGLIGKPAGIPYCPDAAIRTAAAKSGRAEQSSPSCPAASRLGSVNAGAGVGSEPFHVTGTVYWAGPYKGAPFSAVVVTPAVAGPFDLGNVVVRAPLYVNPETAEVTTKSDPLPTILRGIPLKVRSVAIYLDRQDFTLNPTNCEPMKITSLIYGSSGATAHPSERFKVGGCKNLAFKPKLKLSLKGSTKHAGHPALKAVLTYPKKGDYANIARAQVNLPHSEFIDQGNLDKTCTRPVLLEGKCTKRSIYGRAKAWTPLLDKPLEGPVYLVGGYGYKLPALVAELNGQIRVLLIGKVDSGPNKGIRNTFEAVPDAPVSRFVLKLKGGPKYSLLENSENLCAKPQRAIARFTAQNGRVRQWKPKIANSCSHKRHKKKHRQHSKSRQSAHHNHR